MSMNLIVFEESADFDQLKPTWDHLLSTTPLATGFHSFAWVHACWQTLPHDDTPHIIAFIENDRTVAIFPCALSPKGNLHFIGKLISNYAGPVYDAAYIEEIADYFLSLIESDDRIKTVDLDGFRAGDALLNVLGEIDLDRLGRGFAIETHESPEVEFYLGWEHIYHMHGGKQRSGWKRKWKKLAEQGELVFAETADFQTITNSLPRLYELFEQRWQERKTTGGFSPNRQPYHSAILPEVAKAEHVWLSTLNLDDKIVAFNLGIRENGMTTSYVLGHDNEYNAQSPGLLLLIEMLKSAVNRGDAIYDFSLGQMPYKMLWANNIRSTYRLLWGKGARFTTIKQNIRIAARNNDFLRNLKQRIT